jgi:hypothetical protein
VVAVRPVIPVPETNVPTVVTGNSTAVDDDAEDTEANDSNDLDDTKHKFDCHLRSANRHFSRKTRVKPSYLRRSL